MYLINTLITLRKHGYLLKIYLILSEIMIHFLMYFLCYDKQCIANKFNDYFTHISPDLAGNINTDNKLPFDHYLGDRYEREFNFNLTTAGEVLKLSAQPYGQPNAKYVHFCTCTRYLMCT